MSRPRLLDLFSGAGGAAMGYARAGFEVIGVDTKPQPKYPFEIIKANALELLETGLRTGMICGVWRLADFDAIHASPPCQAHSSLRTLTKRDYPELIASTRELLLATGLAFVIENVVGAPLRDPVQLCGTSFALPLRRHRLFESNVPILVPPCAHGQMPKVHKPWRSQSRAKGLTRYIEVYGQPNLKRASVAMGIDWMGQLEIAQAIPPIYTEHIGGFLRAALGAHA